MKRWVSRPRHQQVTALVAVSVVLCLAVGLSTSSDAAAPFGPYGGGGGPQEPGPAPTLDKQGPFITAPGGGSKALRLSRAGVLVFALGPFREDVRGTVSFATTKAVAATKRRLSFGTKRFRAGIGKKAKVRVVLPKKARRAVRRNGKVRVRARVVVRDFIGNVSRKSFTFTLKRPK